MRLSCYCGLRVCLLSLLLLEVQLYFVQFARLYPLNQLDLPVEKKHVDFGPLMAPGAKIENPSRDYTPPSKP